MFRKILRRFSKSQIVLGIAFLVGGLIGVMDFFQFNTIFEAKTLDIRFLVRDVVNGPRRPSADDPMVLVLIDDQSLEELKTRWPWPRSMYAKAVRNLSAAGAKVIAFDLVFSEPTAKDAVFAQAMRQSKSAIVLGGKFYAKKTPIGVQTAYVSSLQALDPYRDNVGYVNFWEDPDGVMRHGTLVQTYQDKPYEAFAMKVLADYFQARLARSDDRLKLGPAEILVDERAKVLINYRGGPGSFRSLSFSNIVDDAIFPGLMENNVFRDKIVLIGPAFTEAQDYHHTPFARELGPTLGVEIHASVLDTILSGTFFTKLAKPYQALLVLLTPVLLALASLKLRPWQGLMVLVGSALLYVGLAVGLFTGLRIVIPVFNPLLALAVSHMLVLGYLLVSEEMRSRQIKSLFSRYVSPKVVDHLVRSPELRLGGNRQTITVLFSDIRGFTTLSEQLLPEQVVVLLNEYFQTMTEVIFRHDGMVDKFIGDAIMAIFGAPVAHPDDPGRAVRAALDMKAALAGLKAKWAAEGKRVFDIGVGINTGVAIVGNMGSSQAMGYTAIGDTVNLASRLESANKEVGSSGILISESTYRLVAGIVETVEHPGIKVKGKANAMSVYEVTGLKT